MYKVHDEPENPFRRIYATLLADPEQAIASSDDTLAFALKRIISPY